MNYGLSEAELDTIRAYLSREPGIRQAVLFGSRALGTFKEASDIDIAIKGEGLDIFTCGSLKSRLEDETTIPYFFDFVAYDSLSNEALREHIDSKGVVIFDSAFSEWRKCKLGDLINEGCADLQTGPFGTMLNASEYKMAGIPVIAVQDIGNNKLTHERLVFIDEATAERLQKYKVQTGDIIFGRKGAVDRRARINAIENGWIQGSDCIRLRFNAEKADSKFISYQFGSNTYREWMLQNSTGATMPSLNQEVLRLLPITLPSLPEQEAIAAVLGSLDDKIDLLHRQNKTLEAMAETLFRQWFVEETEQDLEEKSLLELIELVGGGTPKTTASEYWNGDIPWLSGGDISSAHKGFVLASEKTITKTGLDNSSAKLLPKFATVISARGTVGKYCLVANNMAFSQSNYGILPKINDCFFFTYLLVNHVVEELQSAAYGSVFDTITTATFRDARFATPPAAKVFEFEKSIAGYFNKKLLNQTQIRTLETLRDTLLPKLMSGEVRVALDA